MFGAKHLSRALLATLIAVAAVSVAAAQQSAPNPSVRPPANAVGNAGPGPAPDTVTPNAPTNYDAEIWRRVRGGLEGQVSIPDKKAGVLVQSGGEAWRNFRNGPLPTYGVYAMGGMLGLLAIFFLVRGRIRIDHGACGQTIQRFNDFERTGHWLMAVSFIILGLTGLNVLYGRYVLLPVIGKETFALITMTGKWLHNYVSFGFMVGLAISFVVWVIHNIPTPADVRWLLAGGGMFKRGSHPPAKKFNAGQKILFWLIMLSGVSISMSGLAMMFPFQFPLFAKTFGWLSGLGIGAPTTVTAIQEMQLATSWHAIMALFLVCVIFAHVYIGTIGMEGAFSAMGSGQVDVNWAREHHSIWAEKELARLKEAPSTSALGARPQAAE